MNFLLQSILKVVKNSNLYSIFLGWGIPSPIPPGSAWGIPSGGFHPPYPLAPPFAGGYIPHTPLAPPFAIQMGSLRSPFVERRGAGGTFRFPQWRGAGGTFRFPQWRGVGGTFRFPLPRSMHIILVFFHFDSPSQ